MNKTRRTIIALLPLLVGFSSIAVAQNRERFTISAKAGA
jgi:hypothetical protein